MAETAEVATRKVLIVCPPTTVIVEGADAGDPAEILTTSPLAGAKLVNLSVAFALNPPATDTGDIVNDSTRGA